MTSSRAPSAAVNPSAASPQAGGARPKPNIVVNPAYIGFTAYDDDSYDGEICGWGMTEEEAVNDLLWKLDDSEQM